MRGIGEHIKSERADGRVWVRRDHRDSRGGFVVHLRGAVLRDGRARQDGDGRRRGARACGIDDAEGVGRRVVRRDIGKARRRGNCADALVNRSRDAQARRVREHPTEPRNFAAINDLTRHRCKRIHTRRLRQPVWPGRRGVEDCGLRQSAVPNAELAVAALSICVARPVRATEPVVHVRDILQSEARRELADEHAVFVVAHRAARARHFEHQREVKLLPVSHRVGEVHALLHAAIHHRDAALVGRCAILSGKQKHLRPVPRPAGRGEFTNRRRSEVQNARPVLRAIQRHPAFQRRFVQRGDHPVWQINIRRSARRTARQRRLRAGKSRARSANEGVRRADEIIHLRTVPGSSGGIGKTPPIPKLDRSQRRNRHRRRRAA